MKKLIILTISMVVMNSGVASTKKVKNVKTKDVYTTPKELTKIVKSIIIKTTKSKKTIVIKEYIYD